MKRLRSFNGLKCGYITKEASVGRMRILGIIKPSEKEIMLRGYNREYLKSVATLRLDLRKEIKL